MKKLLNLYLLIFIILLIILIVIFFFIKNNNINNCLRFIDESYNYKPKKCSETEDDDYACNRIQLDEYIIYLNNFFNTLRCLEYSNPLSQDNISKKQYLNARNIFINLYKIIFENDDIHSLSYLSEFSRDLYQRNIYYYPYINKIQNINNIPIFNYVKNNDCLLPLLEKQIKAPLVHFDTHSDHVEFENFDEYHKLINENPMNLSKISQITYDIACFSSYYLYYSKSDFFWISPDWLVSERKYNKQIFKMIKNPEADEIQYIDTTKNDPDSYLHVSGTLKNNFALLSQDINDDFVLSIDLDYFCCNGLLETDVKTGKFNSELLDDSDFASYGRTRYQLEFINPYHYYNFDEGENIKKQNSYNEYIKNLKYELKLIVQRLEEFKQYLLYIKKEKKVSPVSILISDSCNIHLSRDFNSVTLTNDFCPQNLVLFIRHKLFIILQEVYSNKVVPYLEWCK